MNIFTTDNTDTRHNYAGETLATVEHDGFTFTLKLEHDSDHGAPWKEECGHGPVTEEWRTAKVSGYVWKNPGEVLLSGDYFTNRNGAHVVAYDMQEAVRIARRDGWGFMPGSIETDEMASGQYQARGLGLTAYGDDINAAISALHAAHKATFPSERAYAAAAARADFDRLKAWCDYDWCYVGAIVTVERKGIELARASLWGIESDAGEYFLEVGNELAEQALEEARNMIADLVEGAA